jgi:hypothetical protein
MTGDGKPPVKMLMTLGRSIIGFTGLPYFSTLWVIGTNGHIVNCDSSSFDGF